MNFANPDMVGHTGVMKAAVEAVTTPTRGERSSPRWTKVDGVALITADHGNCELMFDPATGQPHTAHTTNPVPLILVDPQSVRFVAGRRRVGECRADDPGHPGHRKTGGDDGANRCWRALLDPRTDHRATHRNADARRVLTLFGHAVDRVVLQAPPRMAMGDLATPVALELAKALKRKPREIAEALVDGMTLPTLVQSVIDRRRRLPQLPLRPRRVHRGAHPQRSMAPGAPTRRARDRRAHQHQSQQGGAHRPPPQRRPRRHAASAA